MRAGFFMVLLAVSPAIASAETSDPQLRFIKAIDRMMVELAPQSSHASQSIKRTYRAHLSFLVLPEFDAVADALNTGGLVPLPVDPRFNVKPRVDGQFPIGEKDLDNQESYISARPATIGVVLDVASRVKSGPIEITSLVRHSEYQGTLSKTNGNAVTSIPMHTMGLAFDIALVNTPLSRVYEIRDVLERMQTDGEILFIGERQQLVFHVVPSPSRLGYFTDVYARALTASVDPDVPALEATPVRDVLRPYATASVTAEVIDVAPTAAFAEEWWAAGGIKSDLTVEVPSPTHALVADQRSFISRFAAHCYATAAAVLQSAKNLVV